MQTKQPKQQKIFLGSNKDIPIKKSWGQNFIIDDNTIKKIIRIIKPHKDEHIIEIGPGRGALTISLLKKVKKITALEIDPLLTEYLNKKNLSNLELYNIDFLKWEPDFKNTKRVIGNLPYYISSPIIFNLIENKCFSEIIIMVQKEVALRLIAKPNTKDYSRMSVVAQTFCNISYETDISKNIFLPKPKVDSSIVKLTKKKTNLNIQDYSAFIKQCFISRRKKIKNNLKVMIDNKSLDFLGNKRPEDLSISEYIDIFNKYSF